MQALTPEGRGQVSQIAGRHGVSEDAVLAMLEALSRGGGAMAQFNHPEFGGAGQWMMGGMTMVSDLFNNALKARVDAVCYELSALMGNAAVTLWQPPAPVPGGSGAAGYSLSGASFGNGNWWPGDLGYPNASGSQNGLRYAYFAGSRRLAVDIAGTVTVYDTGDHIISGVGQQQGDGWTLTFTSQYGTVPLSGLRIAGFEGPAQPAPEPASGAEAAPMPAAAVAARPEPAAPQSVVGEPVAQPIVQPAVQPTEEAAGTGPAITEEALSGSRWSLEPVDGEPFGTVTLMADTGVAGGAHPRMRYWSAEGGVLFLYDAGGRPSARFDRVTRDGGVPAMMGSDPATGTGYVLRSQAVPAAGGERPSGSGVLAGPLEVAGSSWSIEGADGVALATLRLLPGGAVEGGRASEGSWRIADDALLLCHAGGRPTSRFDLFQYRAGRWTLMGTLLSDEGVAVTLRQL